MIIAIAIFLGICICVLIAYGLYRLGKLTVDAWRLARRDRLRRRSELRGRR